jgi:hypothetical protein
MNFFFESQLGEDCLARSTFSYEIINFVKLMKKVNKLKMQKNIIEKVRKDYERKHPQASKLELSQIYPHKWKFFSCCGKSVLIFMHFIV